MIMLGIDPGLRFSGFGVLKKEKQRVFLLEYGLLKLSSTKSVAARIQIFHDFFSQKINQHCVTNIALETPFLGKNAQNFLKLGYLRSILYLLSEQNSLIMHEFSPRQVKLSVTGFGGASKEQVARIILRLFPTMEKPKKDDVTDALAVTLCALWKNKNSYLM